MITVICSSKNPSDSFKEHLISTSGLHNKLEVLMYKNNGEFSLTELYNRGLKEATNRYVVFCHDDITIETKQWGNKLIKMFNKNPEFSIIGVAGSKTMPSSGMWWENPKKMYGRVAHTHEDKTWLSTYSDDLGQTIEEVVVCDGVWFAVDTNHSIIPFNEKVEGFHFYDVNFSFDNYLVGNKVGITTGIRINHQSIGQTNDAWETSRAIFADKFELQLPAEIKRTLRKGEKLKVLIGCISFAELTGSELYVYELAKGLIKEGCDVSICSSLGQPMLKMAQTLGIKTFTFQDAPGYKLGDGEWLLKTPDGDIVSEKNVMYNLQKVNFDVIHLNHKPVTEHLMKLYPNTPVICSIHSEVISLEEPVISPQIKKYIAIRPEIKKDLIERFGIDKYNIEVIYNPIDSNQFKEVKNVIKNKKKRILFAGTIDYLRKQTIIDLINTTKNNGEELYIVGKKNDNYLDELIVNEQHVTYFPPVKNIEKLIHECDETAGILLGRTTIEGWMCGKNGWIYDVDVSGNIISKGLHYIPKDIEKFHTNNVVSKIMDEYKKIIE